MPMEVSSPSALRYYYNSLKVFCNAWMTNGHVAGGPLVIIIQHRLCYFTFIDKNQVRILVSILLSINMYDRLESPEHVMNNVFNKVYARRTIYVIYIC